LIAEMEMEFFKVHPEHKGRVKFDKLNNQKRKFKCIFSIHKKLPFTVVPLDPVHIEIDFTKATLPLSDDVLAEGAQWHQTYDITEKEALKKILAPFVNAAEAELKERKTIIGNRDIPRFSKPIPVDKWAPCMVNIVKTVTPDRAPYRALAVLASYLYTAGYDEDKAFDLWVSVADRVGVEPRIFDVWYGQMSLPIAGPFRERVMGIRELVWVVSDTVQGGACNASIT
jgi:DNA primase large subunit